MFFPSGDQLVVPMRAESVVRRMCRPSRTEYSHRSQLFSPASLSDTYEMNSPVGDQRGCCASWYGMPPRPSVSFTGAPPSGETVESPGPPAVDANKIILRSGDHCGASGPSTER